MSNLSGATTAVFIVRLSAALEVPVTVAWKTKDGTAKAGIDYVAASGSVTFEPGETTKQIQVAVYGRAEGDTEARTFGIELYPPENAILDQTLTEVDILVTDESGTAVTSLVVATGPRGLKGDPGLSAYELAKLQGFEGTLEEWIQKETAAGLAAEKAEFEANRAKDEADNAKENVDLATQEAISQAAGYATVAEQQSQIATEAKEGAMMAASSAGKLFFTSPSDPDGTIAGLAATTDGQGFYVAQGAESGTSVKIYQNKAGVAVLSGDQVGSAAVKNLYGLNATTIFSTADSAGEFAFAEKYDVVSMDDKGNILWYILNNKLVYIVDAQFKSLLIDGKTVNVDGILPTSDRDNLLTLSSETTFLTPGSEFEFNPKTFIRIDQEYNVLYDQDEYLEKKPQWDEAYEKSQTVEPQKTNPLAPFAQLDAAGKSQIRVINVETQKEIAVTNGTSNETAPRPEDLDRIVWQSDRADNAPGGLFYAAMPDFIEHAYIARPKLVGWGHSFMENTRFMNKLAELTGLYGYNFGKSSLTSSAIAARQGGAPASYTPVGGVIPASGSVNLSPAVPGPLRGYGNVAMSSIACSYAGVDGMFGWDGTNATFTRSAAGLPVSVPALSPVYVYPITTQAVTGGAAKDVRYNQHDECINLIWPGRNNISETNLIIENVRAMVKYLKSIGKRVIILPDFPGAGDVTGSTGGLAVKALNAALKAEFPEFYCEINGVDLLQNFINHHNPAYAGDLEDVANGVTPRTLRYDFLHPSQSIAGSVAPDYALYVGAEVNAEFVFQFIKSKGWL